MRPSLRNHLVIALGLLTAIGAVAQGVSSYQLCRAGMSALLDLRLEQVAARMRNGYADSIPTTPSRNSQPVADIVISVRKPNSAVPFRSTEPSLRLPEDAPEGFVSQQVNGDRWRIYTLREGSTLIQVAQRSSVRGQLVRNAAVTTLWPTLGLLPLVLAAVWLIVWMSLRKLNQLGREVQAIDATHLVSLPTDGVPVELLPFVSSINRMIERLAQSIESERKFIANAAHELRTPLTALQLQADNLQPVIVESNQERFGELRAGISRAGAMISQLLRLARADAPVTSAAFEPIDMSRVVIDAVSEVLPIAMARGIDIGAEEIVSDTVAALHDDAAVAVRNLVGNAVRYSHDGGRIDLHMRNDGANVVVDVVDTGPGIAQEDLPRVFDRFFRANPNVEGTGLGLSIVKAIAQKYGGSATLRNRDDGQSGVVASIAFPLAGKEEPDLAAKQQEGRQA